MRDLSSKILMSNYFVLVAAVVLSRFNVLTSGRCEGMSSFSCSLRLLMVVGSPVVPMVFTHIKKKFTQKHISNITLFSNPCSVHLLIVLVIIYICRLFFLYIYFTFVHSYTTIYLYLINSAQYRLGKPTLS